MAYNQMTTAQKVVDASSTAVSVGNISWIGAVFAYLYKDATNTAKHTMTVAKWAGVMASEGLNAIMSVASGAVGNAPVGSAASSAIISSGCVVGAASAIWEWGNTIASLAPPVIFDGVLWGNFILSVKALGDKIEAHRNHPEKVTGTDVAIAAAACLGAAGIAAGPHIGLLGGVPGALVAATAGCAVVGGAKIASSWSEGKVIGWLIDMARSCVSMPCGSRLFGRSGETKPLLDQGHPSVDAESGHGAGPAQLTQPKQ